LTPGEIHTTPKKKEDYLQRCFERGGKGALIAVQEKKSLRRRCLRGEKERSSHAFLKRYVLGGSKAIVEKGPHLENL